MILFLLQVPLFLNLCQQRAQSIALRDIISCRGRYDGSGLVIIIFYHQFILISFFFVIFKSAGIR